MRVLFETLRTCPLSLLARYQVKYKIFQKLKKNIKINYENNGNKNYTINGIENRIEQIIANLLDNSISFCKEGESIYVNISNTADKEILVKIIDDGQGFKEKDTSKIFI